MGKHSAPNGTFCWADLATTDVAAAKAFYGSLFGWTFTEVASPDHPYTILATDSGHVGGLFVQPADMREAGIPPCWTPYLSVDDIDNTAERIAGLGGRIVCPPFDIPAAGRMATIADPQGAVVNLWSRQACETGSSHPAAGPGSVCWNELATSDLTGAATFYGALFGWTVRETQTLEHVYVEFMLEAEPVAGMLPVSVAGPNVPPHWLVYVRVADCDAAVATAAAHGGYVCREAFDVPEVGRIAILADPQRAVFAVIALTAPA